MVESAHAAGWWPQLYEPFQKFGSKIADWFTPRSEALANTDFYEISMELPGVTSEDIEVTCEENRLTVKGEKRVTREEKGETFFFSEREYGAFQRTFRLPADASSSDIAAEFKNGVLTLKVAKLSPAAAEGKRIEVRSA